ncbi:MAG: RimK family alpha-L-glutamate ligase [Thermoflexales bacterium]
MSELKIGILVGREWSWPPAFIEEVNERNCGVTAEFARLGGTRMNEPCPYAVLVDRISHEVPYYRSYLKNAMLQGTYVINNPFMWSADDKFFEASLATQLGIKSPKTVVLPNKDYVPGIVPTESLRNLVYPVPWEQHVEYLGGFPVVLKDAHGGGWKNINIVHSLEELFARYNESGLLTMVMQEYIRWDNYVRCMCIGQEEVYVAKYDPNQRRYSKHDLPNDLYDRVVADSLRLMRALGYDMNTIEWAIRDGEPYAIDFMNPAPDMDINSTGYEYHRWCVEKMADVCIHLAQQPRPQILPFRRDV